MTEAEDTRHLVLVLGFVALAVLPLTHFPWLPDLGLTRPLSVVLFALIFAMVISARALRGNLRLPLLFVGDASFWLLILTVSASISVIFTAFYGNYLQAITRLLGYFLAFVAAYVPVYLFRAYGRAYIVKGMWWGAVLMASYLVVEILGNKGMPGFTALSEFVKEMLVIRGDAKGRASLFASEPSFLAYQVIALLWLFSETRAALGRAVLGVLIAGVVVFSLSVTVLAVLLAYVVLRQVLEVRVKRLVLGLAVIALIGFAVTYFLLPGSKLETLIVGRVLALDQDVSFQIRATYTLNLLYVLADTYGMGLGVGQYGEFWKGIYVGHFDYQAFDRWGEVHSAITGDKYMKPWSVLLGVIVDLGPAGVLCLSLFLMRCWRGADSSHKRALVLVSVIALLGAYPIVTPHVWMVLGLIGAVSDGDRGQSSLRSRRPQYCERAVC